MFHGHYLRVRAQTVAADFDRGGEKRPLLRVPLRRGLEMFHLLKLPTYDSG